MKAQLSLNETGDVLEIVINDKYTFHVVENPGVITLDAKSWTGMPSITWLHNDAGEAQMREHEKSIA